MLKDLAFYSKWGNHTEQLKYQASLQIKKMNKKILEMKKNNRKYKETEDQ